MNAAAEEATTQIAEFTQTEAALTTLEAKYSEVPDAVTEEGYQACVEAIRELRPLRTGLDKMRLKLNADDQARIKFRNTEAKRITARLTALEDPIKAAKQAIDDRAEREAEEARQKEQARIEAITQRIAEIQGLAQVLPQDDAVDIQSVLDGLDAMNLSTFDEYKEQAEIVYVATVRTLENALKSRQEFERQAQEQARIAKEQADKQAELDAQAEKQRQTEAQARQKLETEQQAVRAAQAKIEADKLAEANKEAAAAKVQAEKVMLENDRLEREACERQEKEQAEVAAAAEAERQESLRPEKDRLIDWLKKLRFIDGVAIGNKELAAIQTDVLRSLDDLSKSSIARVEVL